MFSSVHIIQKKIRAYGLGNPLNFEFIEPPPISSLESAIERLISLGALLPSRLITPIGSLLASLPMDVILGKMLILGSGCGMQDVVATVAAGLSVQSPFAFVRGRDATSIEDARRAIMSDQGDIFTLINVFGEWLKIKADRKVKKGKFYRQNVAIL